MELAISDYKEALSAESVENLRRILYELHRKLILEKSIGKPKNIHAAIGRRAADKECKDVGTYKDFVLESLWNKRKAKGIPKTAQNNLIDFIIFTVLLFYILTIWGIFRLRKTQPNIPRPYKAFGYPIIPLLYILMAAVICVVLLVSKPGYTMLGLVIVLIGIPIYLYLQKRERTANE